MWQQPEREEELFWLLSLSLDNFVVWVMKTLYGYTLLNMWLSSDLFNVLASTGGSKQTSGSTWRLPTALNAWGTAHEMSCIHNWLEFCEQTSSQKAYKVKTMKGTKHLWAQMHFDPVNWTKWEFLLFYIAVQSYMFPLRSQFLSVRSLVFVLPLLLWM